MILASRIRFRRDSARPGSVLDLGRLCFLPDETKHRTMSYPTHDWVLISHSADSQSDLALRVSTKLNLETACEKILKFKERDLGENGED